MSKVIIIGAGIVGLSCAWSAQRRGHHVTLIDPDFEGDRASHGNAAGIAVTECIPLNIAGLGLKPLKWLVDPLGPLSVRASHAHKLLPWFLALRKVAEPANYLRIAKALAAINDQSLAAFEAVLADVGLHSTLHKRGALTVFESAKHFHAEKADWDLKRSLGVKWHTVGQQQLRDLEPGLAPVFELGVMNEEWAHIDNPQEVVTALRNRVQALGGKLVRGKAVAIKAPGGASPSVQLSDGNTVTGDQLVVAAGVWSASLAKSLGDRVLLESERGYNTTLPGSSHLLTREVIFSKRKFVATPLSIGLRIGGAAEFASVTAAPNYQRSYALLQMARKFLPNLDEKNSKQWMGQRPATPDSLPVIGRSPKSSKVLYAFGHGHLGLTQGPATGELIAEALENKQISIDLSAFSIARF